MRSLNYLHSLSLNIKLFVSEEEFMSVAAGVCREEPPGQLWKTTLILSFSLHSFHLDHQLVFC